MASRTKLAVAVVLLGLLGVGAWRLVRASSPHHRLAQARQALQDGDSAAAERAWQSLAAAGHSDHALVLRGELDLLQGDPAQALHHFNQIQDQGELRRLALALSGRCLLELGNPGEAERAFTFVLGEQPDHLDGHRGLAAVYYDQGAWPRALEHCRHWARLAPQEGRPHRFMGLMLKDSGQLELAGREYEAALSKDLKDHVRAEVQEELAEVLLRAGQFQQAHELLEKLPGESAGLLTARADAARGVARAHEALPLVNKAVQLDPKHGPAWRLLGRLLLESGQAADAVPALQQAAQLPPRDSQTHHLLAQAYSRLGRVEESRRELARVKEIQGYMDELTRLTKALWETPRDARLHLDMAGFYDKMSMPEAANRQRRLAQSLSSP